MIRDIYERPISELRMLKRDRVAVRASSDMVNCNDLNCRVYNIADNGDALIPIGASPLRSQHGTDNYLVIIESSDRSGDYAVSIGNEMLRVIVIDAQRTDSLETLLGEGAIRMANRSPLPFHDSQYGAAGVPVGDMYISDMIENWGVGPYNPAGAYSMLDGQADIAYSFLRSYDQVNHVLEPIPAVTEIFKRYLSGDNPPLQCAMIQHIAKLIWNNPRKIMLGGYTMDDDGWEAETEKFYTALADWAERNGIPIERLVIMIDEPKVGYHSICDDYVPECWVADEDDVVAKRIGKLTRAATKAGFRVGPTILGGPALNITRSYAPESSQYWFVGDMRKADLWNRYIVDRDTPLANERHGLYFVDHPPLRQDSDITGILSLGLTCYAAGLNSLLYWSVLDAQYAGHTDNVWSEPLPDWSLNFYWPPHGTAMPKPADYVVPSIRLAYLNHAVRLHTLASMTRADVSTIVGPDLVWHWSNDLSQYADLENRMVSELATKEKNMIPTCIGVGNPYNRNFADALVADDLQPYTSQARYNGDKNLLYGWDNDKKRMRWSDEAIAFVQLCPEPMIMQYGSYFYDTNYRTMRYRHLPNTPLDDMPQETLIGLLQEQRAWFDENDMPDAWVLFDEPPHQTNNPEYADRWSLEIEKRVVKFATALVEAGWPIRVAMPGHWQINYWRPRLPAATKWILHDHCVPLGYLDKINGGVPADTWLYNKQDTYVGLADNMREMGATGYLVWDGTYPYTSGNRNPQLWHNGATTDEYDRMMTELRSLGDVQPPDPPPTNDHEARIAALENEIKTLKAAIAAGGQQ